MKRKEQRETARPPLRHRGGLSTSLTVVAVVLLCLTSSVMAATNGTSTGREYIVEHNIFSPDRKYTPEQKTAKSKAAKGAIKLVGIILAGDLKEAVISIKGANPPVMILKEGEEANGCKVVSITSQKVVIERNGKRETLVFEEEKSQPATKTASKGKKAGSPPPEPEKPPTPSKEEIEAQKNSNPFFKILESVRKHAGKKGENAPPPVFPFH